VAELLLVRHGETDWNRDRRFQGHADQPLNETGRAQARALADELSGEAIDAVYTSDLARAHETAEILAARLDAEVVALRELREIDVGEWQGLTWPEIEERFPDGAQAWRERSHGWESGETYEQLAERVVPALRRIAVAHPGGRAVVVAHGGTVRATRAFIAGVSVAESRRRDRAVGNCEIFRIVVEDDSFRGID
jgi:broad specificity phosphatase PhoE